MEERFRGNLERVRNIVQMYDVVAGGGQGRPTVQESDILRIAVVFLHATIEDLFRDVALQRLPGASPDVLRQLPWPQTNAPSKPNLHLGDIADFRGKTVDQLIDYAIQGHLSKSNFNHPFDLKKLLEWVGIDARVVDPHFQSLGGLMTRRHWIVHRCDRNDAVGRGQHPVKSISKSSILTWLKTVEEFGLQVVALARST
jgi:hypothetical protein